MDSGKLLYWRGTSCLPCSQLSTAWLWPFRYPRPGQSRRGAVIFGLAWLSLFGFGLAWLTASGRAMHSTRHHAGRRVPSSNESPSLPSRELLSPYPPLLTPCSTVSAIWLAMSRADQRVMGTIVYERMAFRGAERAGAYGEWRVCGHASS